MSAAQITALCFKHAFNCCTFFLSFFSFLESQIEDCKTWPLAWCKLDRHTRPCVFTVGSCKIRQFACYRTDTEPPLSGWTGKTSHTTCTSRETNKTVKLCLNNQPQSGAFFKRKKFFLK